jgi:hypothetical protein
VVLACLLWDGHRLEVPASIEKVKIEADRDVKVKELETKRDVEVAKVAPKTQTLIISPSVGVRWESIGDVAWLGSGSSNVTCTALHWGGR